MIDFIEGTIAYRAVDYLVLQTGGVGYRIFCTHPFQWEDGETSRVFTHQVVREDSLTLYGFREPEVRDLFRLLLEVSGIGPKVALSITGAGSPASLAEAVQREDLRFLTQLPGIGKKTAQRIVLDLKDKLEKAGWNRILTGENAESASANSSLSASSVSAEAIEALKTLGYNEEEASRAVETAREAFGETEPGLDDWIRRALQVSMKK
ncbi:Holliday junction branch migration protein RuvA [Paludifilum halophilum]|uniref:Holliday junction branch migration complex subunit RuvA n=1 Tax=Paludifilum halophilum TaxID=1642702 RepID=A0A235BCA6_9BACL|nr:Holliday junction branch migration protein RuvA [Paludifilum halophilum]OYD09913.1 Holliday junction branch migration protein RuvA [Paludifilum halophilum]